MVALAGGDRRFAFGGQVIEVLDQLTVPLQELIAFGLPLDQAAPDRRLGVLLADHPVGGRNRAGAVPCTENDVAQLKALCALRYAGEVVLGAPLDIRLVLLHGPEHNRRNAGDRLGPKAFSISLSQRVGQEQNLDRPLALPTVLGALGGVGESDSEVPPKLLVLCSKPGDLPVQLIDVVVCSYGFLAF